MFPRQALVSTLLLAVVPVLSACTKPAAESAPSTVDVVLESAGNQKIAVIKEVRSITGLPLRDAKELVDSAPKIVKSGVSRDEAERVRELLVAAGATVSIR